MQSGFDIKKWQQEAKTRWLKPSEVFFILQNHERCSLSHEAANKPQSGSLFLFNRRVLRFFRKDGHVWRKKKDGRTVGEAHERLKVGNVDALNCYYAHGEQNPYFQRRSYWMLDPAYDHIVLVHYREVSEGRYISHTISNVSRESSVLNQSTNNNNAQFYSYTSGSNELYEPDRSSASPVSVEEVCSKFVLENFENNRMSTFVGSEKHNSTSKSEVKLALRKLAEQLSLDDDDDGSIYFGEKLPPYSAGDEGSRHSGALDYEPLGLNQDTPGDLLDAYIYRDLVHGQIEDVSKQGGFSAVDVLDVAGDTDSEKQQNQSDSSVYSTDSRGPSWSYTLDLSSNSEVMGAFGRDVSFLSSSQQKTQSIALNEPSEILSWNQLDHGENSAGNLPDGRRISDEELSLQLSATREFLLGCDSPLPEVGKPLNYTDQTTDPEARSAMMLGKENGTDWIGSITPTTEHSTYSLDYTGLWFDQNQFGTLPAVDSSLAVPQKQWFTICEISPEWAFMSERTKVIITGDFLCNTSECSWAIMFGETKVPAEIVQAGVLRCYAPLHLTGKVNMFVTSRDGVPCSEAREFEFRVNPSTFNGKPTSELQYSRKDSQELMLLVKLVNMLFCSYDGHSTPILNLGTEVETFREIKPTENMSEQSAIMDLIVQELLKDKLQQWLLSRRQTNKSTNCPLSKQEQGIIHVISGLGYEWALNPILSSGVGINFRDSYGWTALHWAARFGRETMVTALLAANASAGAVTDPTAQDPVGKNPAAIAAACGHKGLAGYLSEVALTSHLSSLILKKSEITEAGEVEAERGIEQISQKNAETNVCGTEAQLSFQDTLAAVRNATQAAARIQSAFRAHSFRKRQQQSASSEDEYGMTQEEIHRLSAVSKVHRPRDQYFDKAALSIQKKYRGWKGRKDFLTLRQNVVKIQAYVRGHQVRKYKEVLWTVGIVEKAILRWRRKRAGLRGFRAEPDAIDEDDNDEDIAKDFRKQKVDAALDEALSRVLSMVDFPEAQQQYRRLLESYRQAKAEADVSNADEVTRRLEESLEMLKNENYYMYQQFK
ncbi:calmodulin-binding transcription activator 4-like isoform X1 [Dioscorea cayenensis subsp. rotundata]|uniref:Calmodulin-binding transcription activator 4-like isoform X1 n=1 Tax=Dioscorea cayennensis subsp. rotundata TaxID=55577 RepID=A0AB40C183_DIOCR|nr:calmodulin-binding transcription activator 4-like isoform X1 [Dioscorea cayenensis subsp. rotundata]